MELLLLFLGAALVNNIVLTKFLGICPFLGVSKKIETATGMGMAVIFVMTLSSMITYCVYNFILKPLHMEYFYTVAFILVIAALVQFVEMVIQKTSPSLYSALGVYLPLITTNCAVLGIAIVNMQQDYSLIESIVNGAGSALSFTLAMVLLAGIRERIEDNDILPCLQGIPISLITAGFMSIAFLGFQNLIK